jgi:hypothetical protein
MEGTHVLKIRSKSLLDLGIVGKVDGLDLATITAFVPDLGLAGDTLIPVSTDCHQNYLMKSGSSISQQRQNRFFTQRDLLTVYHGIKNTMHSLTYIS